MNLEYLKYMRKSKSYSQDEAASKIGISIKMYQSIEQGRRIGTVDTIVKMCSALGLDANILLNLKEKCSYGKQK